MTKSTVSDAAQARQVARARADAALLDELLACMEEWQTRLQAYRRRLQKTSNRRLKETVWACETELREVRAEQARRVAAPHSKPG